MSGATRSRKLMKRLHWVDFLIMAVLAAFFLYVWLQIEGKLNYIWRWDQIPNYLFFYDERTERWTANVLIQGLITTIRISIYASILALILGVILGIARTVTNLTVRMLARTYLEFLRNIPPLVVIFIFYFFLSEQLIAAMNIEDWAYGVARQEDNDGWEFFFGDMRRFPSLISGVIVLALFESAFVGEIVRAGIESIGPGTARSVPLARNELARRDPFHRHAPGAQESPAAARQPVHIADQGQRHHLPDIRPGPDAEDRRPRQLHRDDLRSLAHHGGALLHPVLQPVPVLPAPGGERQVRALSRKARLIPCVRPAPRAR